MNPLSLIPKSWLIGAALVLALGAGHVYRVHAAYGEGKQDAIAERASRDLVAVVTRTQENEVLATQQAKFNLDITKVKDEELAPVVRRIYVDRVRVGPAICNGPASPPTAQSAGSGDSADPPGRLVPSGIEADIRAMTVAVEQDLATGRACQSFLHKNGLVP